MFHSVIIFKPCVFPIVYSFVLTVGSYRMLSTNTSSGNPYSKQRSFVISVLVSTCLCFSQSFATLVPPRTTLDTNVSHWERLLGVVNSSDCNTQSSILV